MTSAGDEPGYPGHRRLGSQCVEDRSEIGEEAAGVSDLIPQLRDCALFTEGDWPSEFQRLHADETHCRLAVSLDT